MKHKALTTLHPQWPLNFETLNLLYISSWEMLAFCDHVLQESQQKNTRKLFRVCSADWKKIFFVKSDTWIHSTWLTQQLIKGNGQVKSKMSLCRWETSWPVSWENKPYRFLQTCNYVYIQPPCFYTHFILAQQKLSQFFSYFKTAMYRRDHSCGPLVTRLTGILLYFVGYSLQFMLCDS